MIVVIGTDTSTELLQQSHGISRVVRNCAQRAEYHIDWTDGSRRAGMRVGCHENRAVDHSIFKVECKRMVNWTAHEPLLVAAGLPSMCSARRGAAAEVRPGLWAVGLPII